MSHDLLTQLSEYGTYCDERQGTVTADDITDAVLPLPMATQPSRPRQGWLIAVAAAALVLLVAGGLALLAPFGGNEVAPINEPAVTTIPTPTTVPATTIPDPVVTTTDPQTTLAADRSGPSTTVASSEPTTTGAPSSSLLDDALSRESVSSWYGGEVLAELAYIDAYLKGMSGSPLPPEPMFDTSALGIESVLIEIDRSALSSLGSYADNDREPIVEHPFLAGAQLAGTTHAAAYRIDIGFENDLVTPNWSLNYTSAYVGETWPVFDDPTRFNPTAGMQLNEFIDPALANIILLTGHMTPETPVTISGLPPNASVVATTLGDGSKAWQRPIAGIAMFEDPNTQCLDTIGSPPFCEAEYTVLNADGTEILTIVITPAHGDDTRIDPLFRVTTP